jgi:aspartyl-tRNA(Asn)/glutamyl-tRNA(Gln) amidotransferase subunit A
METLTNLSTREAASLLQRGEISSTELTKASLEMIERLESSIHAFITPTADLALKQAASADVRLGQARKAKATSISPLLGIPIVIKDVLCLKDIRCTAGSHILDNFTAPYTATSVQRLLDEGVVVLGKTNTDEFAMGSSTENSGYGATHNPWDFTRVPGGSSGGSAAAVAARYTSLGLGSDTGGSIRQPASFCGLTGLKVTYGRISRYGLIAYGSSLDTVGVLARNASDIALAFECMAGHDPLDATSSNTPVTGINLKNPSDLRGLRIGIPKEYFISGVQIEVNQTVREAISILESLGASLIEISLPHTAEALPVYYLIAPAEASANLARFDGVRYGPRATQTDMIDMYKKTRGNGFGPEVKRRIMLGTYALSAGYYDAYYGQAQKVRTLIKQDFDIAFQSVDVIAAPVAPSTAFRFGEHASDPLAMYLEDVFTLPANLAGIPGLAFSTGFDKNNLPIGMQLMGSPFSEGLLLRICHAYQQITDHHLMKPAFVDAGIKSVD